MIFAEKEAQDEEEEEEKNVINTPGLGAALSSGRRVSCQDEGVLLGSRWLPSHGKKKKKGGEDPHLARDV